MLYKIFIYETEQPYTDACKNIFLKKMSDNTGLQKNYILCTANLKKQNKKTNLQTRRLHTNTPCTSITLSHGYFSTP